MTDALILSDWPLYFVLAVSVVCIGCGVWACRCLFIEGGRKRD